MISCQVEYYGRLLARFMEIFRREGTILPGIQRKLNSNWEIEGRYCIEKKMISDMLGTYTIRSNFN